MRCTDPEWKPILKKAYDVTFLYEFYWALPFELTNISSSKFWGVSKFVWRRASSSLPKDSIFRKSKSVALKNHLRMFALQNW